MDRGNSIQAWPHQYWPEPWRSAWIQAVKDRVEGIDSAGRPRPRPETCLRLEMAFGHYQVYLARHDLHDVGLSISPDNLRAFGGYQRQTLATPNAVARAAMVLTAMRFMCPDADIGDAQVLIRRITGRQCGPHRTMKMPLSTHRLRRTIDAYIIGKGLIADAENAAPPTVAAARRHCVGSLLVAAAVGSIRLHQWCALKLDENLNLKNGDVFIPASEIKNGRSVTFRLPPDLLAILCRYVQHYRPLLLQAGVRDKMYLWPSSSGGAASPAVLRHALRRATRKRPG